MSEHLTLRTLTPEAEQSLGGVREISIKSLPFRVGRESRENTGVLMIGSPERRLTLSLIENHLHLHDFLTPKVISREHFQIEAGGNGGYMIKDRNSACGTIVGHVHIGGNRKGGSCALHHENVIIIGGPASPYAFQFLVSN